MRKYKTPELDVILFGEAQDVVCESESTLVQPEDGTETGGGTGSGSEDW